MAISPLPIKESNSVIGLFTLYSEPATYCLVLFTDYSVPIAYYSLPPLTICKGQVARRLRRRPAKKTCLSAVEAAPLMIQLLFITVAGGATCSSGLGHWYHCLGVAGSIDVLTVMVGDTR
jgi:hypothetical protein